MEQEQTTMESPPEDSEVHVIDDSEAEQARKRELEERLRAMPEEPTGEEPATRGAGSPATIVREARKHVGYRESGENDTKFNRWLGPIPGYAHGGFGYPWCHSFVSYCLAHSGSGAAGPRTASCAVGAGWFKSQGRFHSTPKVGDLVYYGTGGGTHVELVVGVSSGAIQTIGGNTSGSLGGNYFNGDGVYEKTVDRSSSRIHGYGRPAYASGATPGGGGVPGTSVTPMTSIRTVKQQQKAVNRLGYEPKLDEDGEWGPKTEAGVKWLQKKVGTKPDGEWGKETEAKFVAQVKAK